jgi:RNA methyltransferase, TrmH family
MAVSPIGVHNARFREVRRALRAGSLTEDGWLPVEGPRLVEEAVSSGLEIGEVFLAEGADTGVGAQTYRLPEAAFRRLAATREPQGVIALVRLRRSEPADILAAAGLVLILCGLQDPGNVGTILRLGDAFGATGCIGVGPTASFHNDKVVRASAGGVFRLPHARVPDATSLGSLLGGARIAVVGTARDGEIPVDRYDWSGPTAVLFGNEGAGLGETERTLSDTLVLIPYPGRAESLNTATAAAIVLWEAGRTSRERTHGLAV